MTTTTMTKTKTNSPLQAQPTRLEACFASGLDLSEFTPTTIASTQQSASAALSLQKQRQAAQNHFQDAQEARLQQAIRQRVQRLRDDRQNDKSIAPPTMTATHETKQHFISSLLVSMHHHDDKCTASTTTSTSSTTTSKTSRPCRRRRHNKAVKATVRHTKHKKGLY